MSAHTPGPWRLVTLASSYDSRMKGYGVAYGRAGNRLALVDGEGNSSHDNEANARLIAAAPELLEALERAVDELTSFKDDAVCDHSVGICWCSFHGALHVASKAIAKAKGSA